MKVTIKDIEILQTLHPSQVAAYLTDRGWQQQQSIPQKAIIWRKEIHPGNGGGGNLTPPSRYSRFPRFDECHVRNFGNNRRAIAT
ncbi:hypothetical protein [Laspinema olomoucense]|uniref:hypothetical protein n=1 Tax=Laspinema olomoucense TaxID=3231600 RepID=UPI0021BAC401|nr:hypothetical protein [Laspinema sp. D3c]MCT7995931.1 hypothetical protein [Laspinema sp. D3c]